MSNLTAPSNTESLLDCIIVGAGPAGLTAAEYLARFHRSAVTLGMAGPTPRLLSIDRTYNLPGYPAGVPGAALLARLCEQAKQMGAVLRAETATRVEGCDGEFRVQLSDETWLCAKKIILAMGVRDRHPDIPGIAPHIGKFVRYCPVCDGYEHTGKQLGILGSGGSMARHALFLETFSNRITIFLHGESAETLGAYRKALVEKGIEVQESRVARIMDQCEEAESDPRVGHLKIAAEPEEQEAIESPYRGCGVCLEDGTVHPLAVLYSALGCDLHLEPLQALSLKLDNDGYIVTDINQQTTVPGVYAAGDMVSQINQISVAFGQATIAAVHIHNVLDD